MTKAPRARQSQAEKSAAMRLRLCEATLEVLTEVGYDRLSTPLVCEKAGVSRGALTHHFGSRNALVAAAFGHLLGGWRDDREAYVARLAPGETVSLSDQTEYLWQNVFGCPQYVAALELMLAARMDDDLGRELRAVLAQWRDIRDPLLLKALGADGDDPEAVQMIHLNSCMLRGIAVHMSFDDNEHEREMLLSAWRRFLEMNSDQLPGIGRVGSSKPARQEADAGSLKPARSERAYSD